MSFKDFISIGPKVQLGERVYIGPFCRIEGNVVIEDDVRILGSCVIGCPPEIKKDLIQDHIHAHEEPERVLRIGARTEIREFVTIATPIESETVIGTDCFLLAGSKVSHDCRLDDNVVLTAGAVVAGFGRIGRGSQLGMNATVHQHSMFGAYSFLGANSFFKGRGPAGLVWVGCPARPIRVNTLAINRYAEAGTKETIKQRAADDLEEAQIKGVIF